MQQNHVLLIVLIYISVASCVSPKTYNSLLEDFTSKNKLVSEQDKELLLLSDQIDELNAKVSNLNNNINALKQDSIQNGESLKNLQRKYDQLNESYDLLISQSSREISVKAQEIKNLLSQLEESQNELLLKEDILNDLSISLSKKEQELSDAQRELDLRSAKVSELERIIQQKDSLVTAIKNKVSKALQGLEGEGLTIEQRNGKIYISLEEDLLFASGKYEVNAKGINALNKLADVLANHANIEILVEGHTDNIPFTSNKLIKDNWDLSVLRSTSVVRILLNNDKLNPLQLTAAGRGEYNPISNNETVDGRKMNRRIEMILSPNLDDLYEILE